LRLGNSGSSLPISKSTLPSKSRSLATRSPKSVLLCRAFKQSVGEPPHRYHNNRRIEHAKTLLANPAASVTEIALKLGFSETSSFTTAFRRATGITPTAYCRSLD
jgi:AraC family transcriptional regulator